MINKRAWAVCFAAGVALLTGCAASVAGSSDPGVTQTGAAVEKPVEPTPKGSPSWTPPASDKTVYLTFDDGPWHQTEEVLDILKENDVKATFFQIGKMIRSREYINKRIWAEGHAIGNHTWDHVDLAKQSSDEVKYQLEKTQGKIGIRAGRCMRPPYGSLDSQARKIAQDMGLTPVLWTRDTNDWEHPSKSSILSVLKETKPGDIVLMHDGGGDRQATVDALREALPELKAKGYTFGIVPVCVRPTG